MSHTIYIHAFGGGKLPKGTPISAGAQLLEGPGGAQTFAHAMVVANVAGTLADDVALHDGPAVYTVTYEGGLHILATPDPDTALIYVENGTFPAGTPVDQGANVYKGDVTKTFAHATVIINGKGMKTSKATTVVKGWEVVAVEKAP